ncbi:hypothetical protein [Culicoidibacter larvae]|uniref:LPXTG cell wall anchor domain-containing protein n=1 Tax=Culicoidibacter larvae TaxID=2579976 RepID=A0A5R8QIZ3_9FIRM|nr:hypothetical protein [Culicoidibacter larvae]TLG77227.1 hypothetical protein FEZ08_01020 [Culicoidibacter larvae]
MNKSRFLLKSFSFLLLACLCLFTVTTSVNAASNKNIYNDIMKSYEAAIEAKDAINKRAESLNQVIAAFSDLEITLDNADSIPAQVAAWHADLEQARNNFETAYNENWPIINAYQEDLEQYNLSGYAPEGNITVGFSNDNFNVTDFLAEIEQTAVENTSSALSYGKYYAAYNEFVAAFETYTTGWQPNNPGDPANDFNNVWKPTINSIYEMNFAPLDYTDQELKAMYSTEEYEQFIETYETKGSDVLDKVSVYTDYLVSLSNTFATAKDTFESKLNDFNAETGSSLVFKRNADYLIIGSESALEGLQKAYEFNVDVLKTSIKGGSRSVYDHLSYLGQIRYAGVVSGQRNIEKIVAPEYTAIQFSDSIPMIEVYKPLVVETIEPPVTEGTPPGSATTVLPTTGSNHVELLISGTALIAFSALALMVIKNKK